MKKVALLHGKIPENAPEDEQDVLVQVEAISGALLTLGFEPVCVSFSLNMEAVRSQLESLAPVVVFNLVESVDGQGRLIHLAPALLDAMGLPYTGSSTEAVFLTSNKLIAKKLLRDCGIDTPPAHTVSALADTDTVGGRYIMKSVWEHASIGIGADSVVKVNNAAELGREMNRFRERFSGEWFSEQYIDGREFNLSLLEGPDGPEVLPPAEIRFDDYPEGKLKIVDYRAKWEVTSFEYRHTPRSFAFDPADHHLLERLKDISKTCWRRFGLRGYARVDFRVDQNNTPWVLEINVNPCLSPDGGFVAAAARAGISFEKMVERIIKGEV